jgi:arylsulfatase A-like enzyme
MRHIHWIPILLTLGMAAPGSSPATPQPASRPNVLFLFADDMRADSIGALGNPTVRTPNLDALARRGFALANAYNLGGNVGAVCTPSRNMLLSGRAYFRWQDTIPPGGSPAQRGLLAPGAAPNLPLSMRDAGYFTYHHGKRGNTAPLIQAQFDVDKYLKDDLGDRQDGEPGRQIVDEAIGFLEQRAGKTGERPFFMYLAFGNPHDPRVAARPYLDLYDPDEIPLPPNYLPVHPFDNGEMTIRDELLSPWPRQPDEIRKTLHEYYATISGLDHHIGRLLATLDQLGLADDTIVIFSADQGIAVGSHGLLGKQNLYDHSAKAPLILAGPGIPRGRSDALVYLLDIYPTIVDLVGGTVPEGIDGLSFKPVISGRVSGIRRDLFLAYRNVQRAIRDDRWKLIRYPDVDVTQLFDLDADPDELRNLAADQAQATRVAEMMAALRRWQERLGDRSPLEVTAPQPAAFTPPTGDALRALRARWNMK